MRRRVPHAERTLHTQRHCAGSTQLGRNGSSPGSSSAGLHTGRFSDGQLTLHPWQACVLAMLQPFAPEGVPYDVDPPPPPAGADWQATTQSDKANVIMSWRMEPPVGTQDAIMHNTTRRRIIPAGASDVEQHRWHIAARCISAPRVACHQLRLADVLVRSAIARIEVNRTPIMLERQSRPHGPASRACSVISNCAGPWVSLCITIARAATWLP